jgi:ABC-type transporter Mla subunit MlaD
MTASIGDVVAQLRATIDALDEAAVQARRAGTDANNAATSYANIGQDITNPAIRNATTNARTAAEKLDKISRLLAEAANAYTTYANDIAPGSAPTRQALDGAEPSGPQLVEETQNRARRAESFLRKNVRKADDVQDSLTNTEKGTKAAFKHFKHTASGPHGGTSTSTVKPIPRMQSSNPHVDNPVTAAIMATGAIAVATRALWNHHKKRKEPRSDDEEQ